MRTKQQWLADVEEWMQIASEATDRKDIEFALAEAEACRREADEASIFPLVS